MLLPDLARNTMASPFSYDSCTHKCLAQRTQVLFPEPEHTLTIPELESGALDSWATTLHLYFIKQMRNTQLLLVVVLFIHFSPKKNIYKIHEHQSNRPYALMSSCRHLGSKTKMKQWKMCTHSAHKINQCASFLWSVAEGDLFKWHHLHVRSISC